MRSHFFALTILGLSTTLNANTGIAHRLQQRQNSTASQEAYDFFCQQVQANPLFTTTTILKHSLSSWTISSGSADTWVTHQQQNSLSVVDSPLDTLPLETSPQDTNQTQKQQQSSFISRLTIPHNQPTPGKKRTRHHTRNCNVTDSPKALPLTHSFACAFGNTHCCGWGSGGGIELLILSGIFVVTFAIDLCYNVLRGLTQRKTKARIRQELATMPKNQLLCAKTPATTDRPRRYYLRGHSPQKAFLVSRNA